MRFFLWFIILILGGLPAHANFNQKFEPDRTIASFFNNPEGPDIEQRLGITDRQEKTIKDYARYFYKNCLEHRKAFLSSEVLTRFCACNAAGIARDMRVQNIQDMIDDTGDSAFEKQRLMVLVFVPCAEIAIADLVQEECRAGYHESKQKPRQLTAVCACRGKAMREHVGDHMVDMIKRRLKSRLSIDTSPHSLVFYMTGTRIYAHRNRTAARHCFDTIELGLQRY